MRGLVTERMMNIRSFLSHALGLHSQRMIGVVLVATAKMQWCPVYSGMNKSSVMPGEEPPAPSNH